MNRVVQQLKVAPDLPGVSLTPPAVAPRGGFQIAYRWRNTVATKAGPSAVGGVSSDVLGYADAIAQVGELDRQFPEIVHWLIPSLRSDVVSIPALRQPLHHLN